MPVIRPNPNRDTTSKEPDSFLIKNSTDGSTDSYAAGAMTILDAVTGLPVTFNRLLPPATPPYSRRRRVMPQWMQATFSTAAAGTYFGSPFYVDAYDELFLTLAIPTALTGVTVTWANVSFFLQVANLKDDITLNTSWVNHPLDATPAVIAAPGNGPQVIAAHTYTNFGAQVRTGLTMGTGWTASGNQNINIYATLKG